MDLVADLMNCAREPDEWIAVRFVPADVCLAGSFVAQSKPIQSLHKVFVSIHTDCPAEYVYIKEGNGLGSMKVHDSDISVVAVYAADKIL
jgi:hypothetical protein